MEGTRTPNLSLSYRLLRTRTSGWANWNCSVDPEHRACAFTNSNQCKVELMAEASTGRARHGLVRASGACGTKR
eukprot:4271522-Pyramimonas_sp.AAC.1